MNPSGNKRQELSTGRGFEKNSCDSFNDFFYKSEAETPSWMNAASAHDDRCDEGEETLLDDAYSRYMSRAFSMESSGTAGGSLEFYSQGSDGNDHESEAEVVLRVAMCCGKCEARAMSLTQLEGVTSALCDRKKEMVTVKGTARPRDVLEACRKLFKQAEMWSPDDTFGDLKPQ